MIINKRRVVSFILATAMICAAFAFMPVKTQAVSSGVTIDDVGNGTYRISDDGSVTMSFTVTNNSSGAISVNSFSCTGSNVLSSITPISPVTITAFDSHTFTVTGTASTSRFGSFDEYITMAFSGSSAGEVGVYVTLYYNAFNPTPSPASSLPKMGLSAKDRSGSTVSAASGDAGETVTLKIPLVCLEGPVSQITISPVLSADLTAFPFVIEDLDYTLKYNGSVGKDNIIEFNYNFKISEKAPSGPKKVEFQVAYYNKDLTRETVTLGVYMNVINGYAESSASPDINALAPKLIVDSYSMSPDKIYAGEQFDVTIVFRNTSSTEDVENVQINVSNDGGKVLPANNSSNTIFIDKIGKGETVTSILHMQSTPDAEAKSYVMNMHLSFAGSKTKQEYTSDETFSVPIQQKIRVKIDDPVMYDDAWQNQSCSMFIALYNMGKASLYNCMVDIEGDGLEMEETYFGGTVTAGNTMRADFSIMPSVAGDINAEVVITYEDVYGEQYEERKPINIYVNEEYVPTDEPVYDPSEFDDVGNEGAGIPTWVWYAGGGVVLLVGVIILIKVLKHKREKDLEDV